MKNNTVIIWVLCLAAALGGCTRLEDPIFEENSSARLLADVSAARATLRAHTDWWQLKYYPSSNKEFGGYNIFAKFISDTDVTLTSDINTNSITSAWAVIPETGAMLTFNGFNKVIHYFSEPGIDSGKGAADSGLKGDFEFIVIESTPEKITLKGKKSGNILTMEPIRTNADQVIAQHQTSGNAVDAFITYRMLTPEGKVENLIKSERTFRLASNANSPIMSYRPTADGLELYSPYTISGVNFQTLKYVPADEAYREGHYTDESGQVKIYAVQTPYSTWFSLNRWYMAYSNIGTTAKTRWDIARTKLQTNNFTLTNVYIGNVNATYPMGIFVSMNNGAAQGVASYTFTPVTGTVDQFRVSLIGAYAFNTGFTGTHYNGGMTDIIFPFNNKTFKITADVYERPRVITITDTADPNNFYRLTLTVVNNPYNN